MPHIDPVVRFWIGIAVTVAIAVSGGTLSLTHVVSTEWVPVVTAWCSIIAFLGSSVLTALNGMATTTQSRLASAAADPAVKSIVTVSAATAAEAPSDKVVAPVAATAAKVASLILLAILLLPAVAGSAMAQTKKPTLTGNPVNDLDNVIHRTTIGTILPPTAIKADGTPTCDFNTFIVLTPTNVIELLQACGQKLLVDSQAAQASAAKANDSIATACLTPGAALVQAAVGTLPADAIPATATSPAIPAVSPQLPGPILIFQKFREFVNAGGITNCKAWVNNTVSAAAASGL